MFVEMTPFMRGTVDADTMKNQNPYEKGCSAHRGYERGFSKTIRSNAFEEAALELEFMCRGLAAHDIQVVMRAAERIREMKTKSSWRKINAKVRTTPRS